MKVFLDSNIFLRYLVPEQEESHKQCSTLIKLAEEGLLIPYVSNMVIAEIVYILTKFYKFPRLHVCTWVESLLQLRNLTIIETTNTNSAVHHYKKFSIKFGDCLIITQIPKGVTLCTYDTDFTKIRQLAVATPSVILQTMRSQQKTN